MSADPFAKAILARERLVAVDVGAANGLLPHWTTLESVAQFYLFEPRADAAQDLEARYGGPNRRNFSVLPVALSGTGGRRSLFVTNAPTGSSLLYPDAERLLGYTEPSYLYPIREVQVDTRTLDDVLDERNEPQVDLIKLDVQGAELEVLRGLGESRLDGLLGVELEVGMPGGYCQQPQFPEVNAFMQSHGLDLYDLRCARAFRVVEGREDYYQKEVFGVHANSPTIAAKLWEVDAVYFRRPEAAVDAADAGALRRLLVVYCTYNFFADAYHLVQLARTRGLLTAAEASALEDGIRGWHRALHYRFYLAPTPLFNFARRLWYRFAARSAPRWCQYMYQDYPSG